MTYIIIWPLAQTQRPPVDKEFQRGVPQVVKPVGSESAQVADASRCQVQFQNFATRRLGQPLQHVRVADVMEPVTGDTPASGLEARMVWIKGAESCESVWGTNVREVCWCLSLFLFSMKQCHVCTYTQTHT